MQQRSHSKKEKKVRDCPDVIHVRGLLLVQVRGSLLVETMNSVMTRDESWRPLSSNGPGSVCDL